MHQLKIKIKKGMDIPIAGQPEQAVGLGEPLLLDKRDPQVQFVSTETGLVVAINWDRLPLPAKNGHLGYSVPLMRKSASRENHKQKVQLSQKNHK